MKDLHVPQTRIREGNMRTDLRPITRSRVTVIKVLCEQLSTIMVVRLPDEVCELVIDELRFSFPELKACSLVCKSWLPRCRVHLYRVIRVGPRRIRDIEKAQVPFLFHQFQESFDRTFRLPEILSCIQGIAFESQMRDVSFESPRSGQLRPLSRGRAVIKPDMSSINLPFQQLRFLRTHWKLIVTLAEPNASDGDIKMFEDILDRIDCLEHLVIEKYSHFHAYRDILRSIAVHAPHLKTLCLSEFRYPAFSAFVDMFDEWGTKFASLCVAPLQLERLCLRNISSKGPSLIQTVILPSSCLDLSRLSSLAMPASDIYEALANERFLHLGKELVHLTITDLDTLEFQLRMYLFPKLSQLQLFVTDELRLLQFLQDMTSHWASKSTGLDLHINFEMEYRSLIEGFEEFIDILTPSIDPVLHTLITKLSNSDEDSYISMDFIQAGGSLKTQCKCIGKAFPQSFATGNLHWRDRRLLEWWFE